MSQHKSPSIGIAVITHNARKHLQHCLPPLLRSPLKPRVLVVNSSSSDGTAVEAAKLGAETVVIPRHSFNHGTTRELARQRLNTDIIVMATPDAYPVDEHQLTYLVQPLLANEASAAYAKQIPHKGADFFEAFHRNFNYPSESHIRGIEDLPKYGVYTFFCSDSCAAYKNSALDEIGGFDQVLIGEDTVAVAKLLRKGHKIAYVAEAVVHHSHSYSLKQEFQRHFDTGLARASYKNLFDSSHKDIQRGRSYLKSLFKALAKEAPHLIPYAFVQTIVKWSGYRIGSISGKAPKWFKKALSGQDFFWMDVG